MPAQPSQTRICNATLVLLGTAQRIGAINEGSPLARAFETVWDEARDAVLADHPWNFALRREESTVSADYTPKGSQWAYAYEKPANMLRWLPWSEDHPDFFDGEEEGDYILSSADSPIIVRGIFRIEDVGRWSMGFRTALAGKLAQLTAKAITGQTGMQDRADAIYDRELRRGKRQDGAATGQRNRRATFRSNWLAARG